MDVKQHLAIAMREVSQVSGIEPGTKARDIRKVAVIGAGLMGSGIAVSFLGASVPVVLVDRDEEALGKGRAYVTKALESAVRKGWVTADQAKGAGALLTTTLNYDELVDCDLVIEAVFERMDIKEEVFAKLGMVCRTGAVLATNTSGLDVDRIAVASGRPADVVGLHFFSPAHVMPLLEIVRGEQTSAEVLRTALFAATITRKIGVVVGNCFGFAANRMLEGYARESEFLVLEGANPEQIDAALKEFGFAMGPCAMADLAGIDVRCHVLDALRAEDRTPDDPRYGAIAKALAAEGRLGQKTKAGYFDYGDDGRTPMPSIATLSIRDRVAGDLGVRPREISDEEIVERCLLPVINEAAKELDEGIVDGVGSVDLIWLYGYGFPADNGGPVYEARLRGFEAITEALQRFQKDDGDFAETYWAPSPALARLFD